MWNLYLNVSGKCQPKQLSVTEQWHQCPRPAHTHEDRKDLTLTGQGDNKSSKRELPSEPTGDTSLALPFWQSHGYLYSIVTLSLDERTRWLQEKTTELWNASEEVFKEWGENRFFLVQAAVWLLLWSLRHNNTTMLAPQWSPGFIDSFWHQKIQQALTMRF